MISSLNVEGLKLFRFESFEKSMTDCSWVTLDSLDLLRGGEPKSSESLIIALSMFAYFL